MREESRMWDLGGNSARALGACTEFNGPLAASYTWSREVGRATVWGQRY